VLSKKKNPYGRYDSDHYQPYYSSRKAGLRGPRNLDYRIYPKELVLGLMVRGKTKAYPFSALKENPIINDELAGKKVLIIFDSVNPTGAIFERKVSGKTLTFRTDGQKDKGLSAITDLETNTIWSPWEGRAIKG
jgi:hypothetical protein